MRSSSNGCFGAALPASYVVSLPTCQPPHTPDVQQHGHVTGTGWEGRVQQRCQCVCQGKQAKRAAQKGGGASSKTRGTARALQLRVYKAWLRGAQERHLGCTPVPLAAGARRSGATHATTAPTRQAAGPPQNRPVYPVPASVLLAYPPACGLFTGTPPPGSGSGRGSPRSAP